MGVRPVLTVCEDVVEGDDEPGWLRVSVGLCVAPCVPLSVRATESDCVCVSNGVCEPDWLAISEGLGVSLGVAAKDAEPVAVPEAEAGGEAMITRRRRLLP